MTENQNEPISPVSNLGELVRTFAGIEELDHFGDVNWRFSLQDFWSDHFTPLWDKRTERNIYSFSRQFVEKDMTGEFSFLFYQKLGVLDEIKWELKSFQVEKISQKDSTLFKKQAEAMRAFLTEILQGPPEVKAYFGEGEYAKYSLVHLEWDLRESHISFRGYKFDNYLVTMEVTPINRLFLRDKGDKNTESNQLGQPKGVDMSVMTAAMNERILVRLTEDSTELITGPLIGRDQIVEKVQRALLRVSRPNAVLVAQEGIGVAAVLGAIARTLIKGTGVKELDRLKPYHLDVKKAAEKYPSDESVNAFLNQLFKELASEEHVLLVLDYAEHLMYYNYSFSRGGKVNGDSFYDFIQQKKIAFIGGLNSESFQKDNAFFMERWGGLLDFTPLPELSPEDTLNALKATRKEKENEFDVSIPEETLRACVYLSHKYIPRGVLPVKAIVLLDDAVARLKFKQGKPGWSLNLFRKGSLVLDEATLSETIAEMTGLPLADLSVTDLQQLRDFEEKVGKRIIGQSEAVKAVAQSIRATRAGFADVKRPDGVFYFLGPSGVGKTELALVLSEVLFGDNKKLLRIDMSEFVHPADVTRLIGAPPGYVGYNEGGVLTEWAKNNPLSILLLDEFEKAHPGCWDVFLQLFDAGRLTDGKGTTVDFSNTIIIMTSNIGSELFAPGQSQPSLGFLPGTKNADAGDFDGIQRNIQKQLQGIFRPEFLNRLDEIIVFHPLDPSALVKIARLQLEGSPVPLRFDESVVEFLAKKGYEPQYGARHLKRVIRQCVFEPIANLVVNGKIKQGHPVRIVAEDGTLRFEESTPITNNNE